MIVAEQPTGSIIFCCLLLVTAGYTDVKYRRISNRLTLPACVAGILYHACSSGIGSDVLFSLKGLAAGFIILLIPFLMGALGGGDVKLFAALGSWLGSSGLMNLTLYTAIAGGIAALGIIIRAVGVIGLTNLIFFPAGLDHILPVAVKKRGVPYSIPAAAGYAAYLFMGPLV